MQLFQTDRLRDKVYMDEWMMMMDDPSNHGWRDYIHHMESYIHLYEITVIYLTVMLSWSNFRLCLNGLI